MNRRSWLLLFGVLLAAGSAWAQVYSSGGPTVNNVGQPVASKTAICTLKPTGTNAPDCDVYVQTYTDNTHSVACTLNAPTLGPLQGDGCTNPGNTDTRGNIVIWADAGQYWAETYGYMIVTYVQPIVVSSGSGGGSCSAWNQLHNGVLVGSEAGQNLIDSPSVIWSPVDDPTNHRVNVTATVVAPTGGCGTNSVGQSLFCRGPYPFNDGPVAVMQSNVCTFPTRTASTFSCSFPNPVVAGDTFVVYILERDGVTGNPIANLVDTSSNTYTDLVPDTSEPSGRIRIAYAKNVAASSAVTISGDFNGSSDNAYQMVILDVNGADPTNPIDDFTSSTSCTTNSVNLPAVSTSAAGSLVLASTLSVNPTAYTYSAGTGYFMFQQAAQSGEPLSLAVEGATQSSAGTYTPTMTANTSCQGINNTLALKAGGPNLQGIPFFGPVTYPDLVDDAGFPLLDASGTVKVLTSDGFTLDWTAIGTGIGSVTSFSAGNLPPLFTTTVSTATTTPALSFTLDTAAPHTFFGNNTAGTATPGFQSIGTGDLPTLSTTVNGATCTIGSSCNVNDSNTANTVALNAGAGVALGATAADSTTTHALFATAGAPTFRALALSDLPAVQWQALTGIPVAISASTVMWKFPWPNTPAQTLTIPADCSTSTFDGTGTPSTGSPTFVLAKNGSTICTGTITTGSPNTIAWTGTGTATTFSTSSDIISLTYSGDTSFTGTLVIVGAKQ